MYAPSVIEKAEAKLYDATSPHIRLRRYTIAESLEVTDHLSKLWDAENSRPRRRLTKDEQTFIANERLLSTIDFSYWCSRYCSLIRDPVSGGGIGHLDLWESQRIVLNRIASLEAEQMEAYGRGEPVDGILLAVHKARQLGATMLVRALIFHRLTTHKYTRAITASVDDDKVDKLYERDKRIYDNLPWFLRPSIGFEEKAQHIKFSKLDSSLLYQTLVQHAGLGQGEQYDIGHITEAASAPYPATLSHDYTPTIPQSPLALHVMETTAQGRDNWWRFFVDDIRKGGTRWRFVFVPWYAEPVKYRRQPSPDWTPNEVSLLHAQKVHDTSPEFIGSSVMLSRDNLYWWESTRDEYARKNELNLFLTNYCATPEESFQHTTQSVFDATLLDELRARTDDPEAYDVVSVGEEK